MFQFCYGFIFHLHVSPLNYIIIAGKLMLPYFHRNRDKVAACNIVKNVTGLIYCNFSISLTSNKLINSKPPLFSENSLCLTIRRILHYVFL